LEIKQVLFTRLLYLCNVKSYIIDKDMKRVVLVALMMVGITVSVSAQHDDLYFVPKKKTKVETSARTEVAAEEETVSSYQEPVSATRGLDMDEDAYNRREHL
jgi:hypothetical protein